MLTPDMGNQPDVSDQPWAVDTGCYNRGDAFDLGNYLCWLHARRENQATCLFATAPDVFGDAKATIRRSLPVLPILRTFGFRAAFVAQSGQDRLSVPWEEFDVLFLGGPNDWHFSDAAYHLVKEAKARGLWVHNGRVNSFRRLATSAAAGFDSADGTFLRPAPDYNAERLKQWMGTLAQQGVMSL